METIMNRFVLWQINDKFAFMSKTYVDEKQWEKFLIVTNSYEYFSQFFPLNVYLLSIQTKTNPVKILIGTDLVLLMTKI